MTKNIPVNRYPQAYDALYVRNEDGTYSPVNGSSGGGGPTIVTWDDVTNKPDTFKPITGTSPDTAKPGDYQPVWDDIDGKPEMAGPDGFATLDANGHLPPSQLPISVMEYQGEWDAATNTPRLTNADDALPGNYYRCDVAGTTNFGAGDISFNVGDYVIYRGSDDTWGRITTSNDVISVNGKNGAVVLTAADIGGLPFANRRWADVSGSRAKNTAYRNTTGHDMQVIISHNSNTAGHVQCSENSTDWIDVSTARLAEVGQSVSFIVPDGNYYRTQGDIVMWSELRQIP